MAQQMSVPFLGAIPFESETVACGDRGTSMLKLNPSSDTARAFGQLAFHLLKTTNTKEKNHTQDTKKNSNIKIMIPTSDGILASHFGHCQQFLLFEVDRKDHTIHNVEPFTPPAHEPGLLPEWLRKMGTDVVIAGGLGMRAHNLLKEKDIEVVVGAMPAPPHDIVRDYLDGKLETGANTCDH